MSYRATKLSPHHVPYPFWFKLLWFKSLEFCSTSEGGAIADCTEAPLAPKCFFADLCQGSHLPTTYGILLLHRRCYRSLYGLEGDSDPPAASAGGWPGCPARQTHWEFVHGQRENWLSQAANRQKTIAPPQPPSTPPPVYSNIGKMETLESRLQYVKHLFQLHAQRKIYLAAKSSCVCANSPSHGMDGCRVPATSRFGSTGAQAGEADTAAGERETKRRKTAMPTCDKSWSLTWIWFAEK